jgi:hypothetical protein
MRTTSTNFLSITASILYYIVVVLVVVVPDNVLVVTATKIRGSSSGSSSSSSSPLLDEDYLSKGGGEEERATAITARKSTSRRLQNPKASEKNIDSSAPSPIPTKGADYDPSKIDTASSVAVDEKEVDEDKDKEMRNTNIVKKTIEFKNKNVGILPMTRGIGSRYINNDTTKNSRKGLLKQAARGPTKLTTTSTALPTKIGDLREPIEVMPDSTTTTIMKFSRSGGKFGTFNHKKNSPPPPPLPLPSTTIAQTRSAGNARIDINNKINNGDKTGGGIIEKTKKKAFKFEKESKKKLVKKDYEKKKYIKNNDKKSKGDDRKERLKDEKKLKKYEYANQNRKI